uniref:Influenza virus NS1A binding protein a n=1 Tax=Eptatretus burgeri TaxID=7764 RepID=A0A8C4QWT1_EPTBU
MAVDNGCLVFEDCSLWGCTSAKLNALRKSGQFCDIRLQVCGHDLFAHRAILACCSPHFFEVFNNGDASPASFVFFEDLNQEAVEVLLTYMYTARLDAPSDLVKEVYLAANMLKMDHIKQVCADFLSSQLDAGNCISQRRFASGAVDVQLLARVDSYIQENLHAVVQGEEFLQLPRLQVEIVLEDGVSFPGNGKLYGKVLEWVQHMMDDFNIPLDDMLGKVQTLHLSADHKLMDGGNGDSPSDTVVDEEIHLVQRVIHRESSIHSGSSCKHPSSPGQRNSDSNWKVVAWEKTAELQLVCLAVLGGSLCAMSLHCRPCSQRSSPTGTPVLSKSPSIEGVLLLGEEDSSMAALALRGDNGLEEDKTLLSAMFYERCGLGVVSLDECLIAAGGYNREDCLRTVERYEPSKNTWSMVAPMSAPRARFQMAALMDRLFVLGGSNGHSDELNAGEIYDPQADTWTAISELGTSRCNAGVAALRDRLYIVGGSDAYGQKGVKCCESFDPISKIWSICSYLHTGRYQPSVCVLDGCLYIAGGGEVWNCLNSVERYDPASDTWTSVAPMNVARRGAGIAAYNGKLFVVGGFDGSHSLASVESYDPRRDEWNLAGTLSVVRSNVGVAVAAEQLYAVGGFTGADFLRSIEMYDPAYNIWSPFANRVPTPQS